MAEESLLENKYLELCHKETAHCSFSAGRVRTEKGTGAPGAAFPGWFLSSLGLDKSPNRPVKRHSPDRVNDLPCLASFGVPSPSPELGGTRPEAAGILLSQGIMPCLPGLWAAAWSMCSRANIHHAGSKITQDLFKNKQLLMLLYLMPTSCYWQSVWSLQNSIYRFSFPDSDSSVRPKNLKLIGHNGRLSITVNYHAKPIYCICTNMNMQAM